MPDGEGITAVTGPRGSDERMAEAFQALGDAPGAEVPEELRERIWLAVSGELPPEERRELVERTVTDPACAEAWRIAKKCGGRPRHRPPAQQWAARGPAARWAPRWLAAAAVLLLGTHRGRLLRHAAIGRRVPHQSALACDRWCRLTCRFRAVRSDSAGHPDHKGRDIRCG